MATVMIVSTVKGCIFVNGGFFSVCENNSITVPLGSETTVINYFSFDGAYCPLCFEFSRNPRISGGKSELYRWNSEMYELKIVPEKTYIPVAPIITRQTMWGKGYAGICGGFFCTEFDGRSEYFPEQADGYEILSEQYALIKKENTVIITDKACRQKLRIENVKKYSVERNVLSLEFSPGNMDFFTVLQQYETREMTVIGNEVVKSETKTFDDKIRCFCQAVRLNMEKIADEFITPSLKAEMKFTEIREFLGNFDEMDVIRYGIKRENSVALRYKTDKWNYVYEIFTFALKNGLIDDIEQV